MNLFYLFQVGQTQNQFQEKNGDDSTSSVPVKVTEEADREDVSKIHHKPQEIPEEIKPSEDCKSSPEMEELQTQNVPIAQDNFVEKAKTDKSTKNKVLKIF